MTESEFMREAQVAVERMREMNARSKINDTSPHKMPPSPSFVRVNNNNHPRHSPPPKKEDTKTTPQPLKPLQNSGFGIPLLDNLLKDGDSALIIGLLLILMSENTDKILLFALVYILL